MLKKASLFSVQTRPESTGRENVHIFPILHMCSDAKNGNTKSERAHARNSNFLETFTTTLRDTRFNAQKFDIWGVFRNSCSPGHDLFLWRSNVFTVTAI